MEWLASGWVLIWDSSTVAFCQTKKNRYFYQNAHIATGCDTRSQKYLSNGFSSLLQNTETVFDPHQRALNKPWGEVKTEKVKLFFENKYVFHLTTTL